MRDIIAHVRDHFDFIYLNPGDIWGPPVTFHLRSDLLFAREQTFMLLIFFKVKYTAVV